MNLICDSDHDSVLESQFVIQLESLCFIGFTLKYINCNNHSNDYNNRLYFLVAHTLVVTSRQSTTDKTLLNRKRLTWSWPICPLILPQCLVSTGIALLGSKLPLSFFMNLSIWLRNTVF